MWAVGAWGARFRVVAVVPFEDESSIVGLLEVEAA